MPSVVAEENDDGVLPQARLVQRREHAAELGVDEGDGGVVGGDGLPRQLGCGVAHRKQVPIRANRGRVPGGLRRQVRGQRDFRGPVKIEVLLRRQERRVRLGETQGQKERLLALEALDEIHGARGVAVIQRGRLLLVRQGLPAVRVRLALLRGAHRFALSPGGHGRASDVPGAVVVQAAVENLPRGGGHVAVLPEVLRQRDHLRHVQAEPASVAGNAGVRGASAGEQRRARRVAQRVLAIGAVESHAAARQRVDVRRLHRKAVAAQPHVEIVGGDEQHVGPCRRRRGQRRGSHAEQRPASGNYHDVTYG